MNASNRRLSILALPIVALLGASCSSPVYVEDVKKPALVWHQMRGLCGRVLGVDADGIVWGEDGGCEDGRPALRSKGRSAPTKMEALRQGFDALPTPPSLATDCAELVDYFSRWTAAGNAEWSTCVSGQAYGDVTALKEPYASVAAKFLALP